MTILKKQTYSKYASESGFMIAWIAMSTIAILVAGFTFMLYAEATVARIKAQQIAMNMVVIGGYNSEFAVP